MTYRDIQFGKTEDEMEMMNNTIPVSGVETGIRGSNRRPMES